MYDTLKPELITATPDQRKLMKVDPTYVVEKTMFLENQFPYLEVRRPFILGTQAQKWKATIAHRFTELLHTKTGKLTRIYTQNIDGLDYQCTKIPQEKIVSVHGTIAEIGCEQCGEERDFNDFCNELKSQVKDIYDIDPDAPQESTAITCKACGAASVKPKTVLFGSSLPSEFFDKSEDDLKYADLLIIVGTSLVVSPANSLVYNVNGECMRLVVNAERVGEELGIEYDDVDGRDCILQGSCDEMFLDLSESLGWLDDLNQISDVLPESSREMLKQRHQRQNS